MDQQEEQPSSSQAPTPRRRKGKELEIRPWSEGKWRDAVLYECSNCAFSTLHKSLMEEHAEQKHGLKKNLFFDINGEVLL